MVMSVIASFPLKKKKMHNRNLFKALGFLFLFIIRYCNCFLITPESLSVIISLLPIQTLFLDR